MFFRDNKGFGRGFLVIPMPVAVVAAAAAAFSVAWAGAWTPGVSIPDAVGTAGTPLTVDTSDRNDVLSFYHCIYAASEGTQSTAAWTGNLSSCNPGTTSAVFKTHVQRRINFYRAMSGVPADIELDATKNTKAQAAALIMAENSALSHNPGADFGMGGCWSADGQEGAQKGNIAIGTFGAEGIDGYMEDPGAGNEVVGHRRWFLHPPQTEMGTGDVPAGSGHPAANSVYVIDSSSHRSTNPVEGSFYTWPAEGYMPSSVVWPRWSLHFSTPTYGSPTFGSATVSMKRVSDNAVVPTTIVHRYYGGGLAGDPTIVWEPDWSAFGGAPPVETEFEITVAGITSGSSGAPSSHTYSVTVINEESVSDPYGITGNTSPPTSGETYSVTALTGVGADQYEVEVTAASTAAWTEGAEDSPAPMVVDGTGSYSLTTALSSQYGAPGTRTGSKVFHLAFPSFSNQQFEIDRTIIPTLESTLSFWNVFRFAVPENNRLSAEISTDSGASWTEIWGRQAGGLSTTLWDSSWQSANVALASYAGQPVRIRFIFRHGGSASTSSALTHGCFLDDIQVTNSSYLSTGTITDLGTGTSFTLNDTTAGGALAEGQTYYLRARPTLGCKTFGWSDPLLVTAVAPVGYSTWSYAATVGGSELDYDLDGLTNGFEYAFGLNPTDDSDAQMIPGATMISGDQLSLTMTEPAGVSGVSYGALWSTDLENWYPLTDTGSGTTHTFLTTPGMPQMFVRWAVVVSE